MLNTSIYGKMTPSLDTVCRVGGVISLVVSEPRFRHFWKSLGLGGSGIEYMIEKHVFSNVLTDVDVLVFCIDGSSSKSSVMSNVISAM